MSRNEASIGKSSLTLAEFQYIAQTGNSYAEIALITKAEGVITESCMRSAGFDYWPTPTVSASPLSEAISLYSYAGRAPSETADLLARHRFGYGLYKTYTKVGEYIDDGGIAGAENQQYISSLSNVRRTAYYIALSGQSDTRQGSVSVLGMTINYSLEGCNAVATRDVFGSVRSATLANLVGEAVFGRISDDAAKVEAVRRAVAAWRSCMYRSTGRRFADLNAPIQLMMSEYARSGPLRAVRSKEIRLSVADGRCEFKVGFPSAYAVAFRRSAATLPPGLVADVAIESTAFRVAAERAAQILRSTSWVTTVAPAPITTGEARSTAASTVPVQIGKP